MTSLGPVPAGFELWWLRVEVRRRWRSLVTLSLLVALCSAPALTSVSGAWRGATAPDRLVRRTLPATALARANVLGLDWDQVRALPDVAAVTTFAGYSGFGVDEAPGQTVQQYIPLDDDAMRSLERPVLLAGRLPDPDRPDEAVVTENFVRDFGRTVGDVVTVRLFSPQQVDTGVSAVRTVTVPHPAGAAVRTRIVGVVRSPWFSDQVGAPGRLIPSPGLFAAYPHDVLGADLDGEQWALVRLRDGDAGLERFRVELERLTAGLRRAQDAGPDTSSDVIPRSRTLEHLRDVSRFEAACLVGLALAILLAASFLLGTAVSRQVAASLDDLTLLTPVGATPGQAVTAAALGPTLAGVTGVGLGAGAAVIGSRWMPFGVAATLEPDPGIRVDGPVLVVGGLLIVAAITLWAVVAGRVGVARRRAGRAARTPATPRRGYRTLLPVPLAVGTRHALERGPGGGTPVRSALIGCVIGVVGVVAATTFAGAVDDAVRSPQRFGQDHRLIVAMGYDDDTLVKPESRVVEALQGDPDVTGLTDLRFQTSRPVRVGPGGGAAPAGGERTITVFGSGSAAGAVLVAGTRAQTPDQVVVAPGTARRLGLQVGSVTGLQGSPGTGGSTVRFTVTGIGFVPQTEYNEYDSGAWLTRAGYRQLFGDGFLNRELLVRVRPGGDPAAVAGRLSRATASLPGHEFLFAAPPPTIGRQVELRDLRVLPLVLGAFLAALAVGATGHVLTVSIRRRRQEIAVLRALGMTRWQAASVAAVQAAVHGLVGLAVGIPLGVALGRVLWRAVTASTPLAYRGPVDVAVLLLACPVTLAAVLLLALPAARRSVRLPVAEALRTE